MSWLFFIFMAIIMSANIDVVAIKKQVPEVDLIFKSLIKLVVI